jgi:dipeptidyl-peptidase-4
MMGVTRRCLSLLLVLSWTGVAAAQELTVEQIFGSTDFAVQRAGLEFMSDGRAVVYERSGDAEDVWVEGLETGEKTRLLEGRRLVPPGMTDPITIEGLSWSADESRALVFTNAQRVWRQNTKGIYYVYDVESRSLRPVSTGEGWQMFAKFSPDAGAVAFVRDNDLWISDLETGEERRLTGDGSEDIINGTTDWVYEEELGLRDAFRWSPDGGRIAYWRFDQSPIKPFFMIDELELYSQPVAVRYPKAGTPNSNVEIRVLDVVTGESRRIDTGDEPDAYLARMEWSGAGSLVVQRLNRHQNRLDVLLIDPAADSSRILVTETDSAWVDVNDDFTWLDGGRRFLWTSERDGWNHIYLYDRDGTLMRQLTSGEWEVAGIEGVDEEAGVVYFTATEQSPLERHLYRIPLDGQGLDRVTRGAGTHEITMSPDARHYVDEWSRAGVPPTTRLHTADGEVVRVLAENEELEQRLAATGVQETEFFEFTTTDGVTLNGWMIRPPSFDETRRYPVVMYVYGGPGSQTVTDAWGGNRYLWHQLLAQEGFIVASIDNRGTGGRGRDFRKVTYLDLGRWETHDQIEGARHLASLPFVDGERIAIWGWSYGGYMTALSMMNGDVFRAGVSVAPVTDWRLYDTIYTERFMRTPEENPEGYARSSPIENAAELNGRLFLIHGTGDDNVHFQNSTQLTNALQAGGKQFDFLLYANRSHSIAGGNTQVHLFTAMTDWLDRMLGPAGLRPAS